MATTFTSQDPNFVDFPTWIAVQLNKAINAHDQKRFAKAFAIIDKRKVENGGGQIGPMTNGSYTVTGSTMPATPILDEMMAEWMAVFNVTAEES